MADGSWREISDAKNPADRLVDPDAIPRITLDEGAMQGAGSKIKSAGTGVHAAGGAIDRTWQGLGHYYQAPEGAQLCSGSGRVVSKADAVQTSLGVVGDAVWHFAAEMQAEIGSLESLRGEVNAFVGWAQSMAPTSWPTTIVPGFAGGDGNLEGWTRNDQLAREILGARERVLGIENRYAEQIMGAFSEAYDPPPGPPHPFHSRTEAEDAGMAGLNDWRSVRLDGDMLPWGGTRQVHDPLLLVGKGIAESAVDTLLAFPRFVGFGKSGSGHWGFSAKTAEDAWLGLAKVNFIATMGIAAPGYTLNFTKNLVKGLVGIDANGHWGWQGLGRGIGNVGMILLTRGQTSGLLAAKGEALAAAASASKVEAAGVASSAEAARVAAAANAAKVAEGASDADRFAALARAERTYDAAGEAQRAYRMASLRNWAAQAVSTGMKAPKALAGNKLAFADVRTVADYVRNYDAGGRIPRMPDLPAPRHALTQQAERESSEVHGAAKGLDKIEPVADFDAASKEVLAAHNASVDQVHGLNLQRLDANFDETAHQRALMHDQAVADSAGRSPAERAQIWKNLTEAHRRMTDQAASARDAIVRDGDDQRSMVGDRMYDRLDDLRAAEGLPPTSGHRPAVLPDAQRALQRQFQATGMDAAQAAAKARELQGLTGVNLDRMTDDQRALVENYVAAGTNITEHTPMSKALTAAQAQQYLKENWATVRGFTTKDPFVHDEVRPVDRVRALALDYRTTQSLAEQDTWAQRVSWLAHGGKGQPYALPLHGYGEIVYRTHPDDVRAYRIPLGGGSAAARDVAQELLDRHGNVKVSSDDPPFTGMGLTGGGVPEYYSDGVRLTDGAKMYWYSPTRDGGVVRTTIATFSDGAWRADRSVRAETLPGVEGEPAAGRDAWSAAAHRFWDALPEANQEKLKELAHGGWAFELSDKQPAEVPEDGDQRHHHGGPAGSGYAEVPSG